MSHKNLCVDVLSVLTECALIGTRIIADVIS